MGGLGGGGSGGGGSSKREGPMQGLAIKGFGPAHVPINLV